VIKRTVDIIEDFVNYVQQQFIQHPAAKFNSIYRGN